MNTDIGLKKEDQTIALNSHEAGFFKAYWLLKLSNVLLFKTNPTTLVEFKMKRN